MRPQLDLEKMQKENPHPELTAHIAALGKMRKENPVLADGKYRELVLTNRQYAYARIKDQDAIVVAANNDENPADMSIPVPVDGTYENAFTKEAVPVVAPEYALCSMINFMLRSLFPLFHYFYFYPYKS